MQISILLMQDRPKEKMIWKCIKQKCKKIHTKRWLILVKLDIKKWKLVRDADFYPHRCILLNANFCVAYGIHEKCTAATTITYRPRLAMYSVRSLSIPGNVIEGALTSYRLIARTYLCENHSSFSNNSSLTWSTLTLDVRPTSESR